MNFKTFLTEMFNDNAYITKIKINNRNRIIFDIYTDNIQNYRMSFVRVKYNEDKLYIAKFGYAGPNDEVLEITDEFYDIYRVIATIQEIFIGLYINMNSRKIDIDNIIYEFGETDKKSYKLLINAIFKNDLSVYYNLIDVENDIKDFGSRRFLIIHNNKSINVVYDKQYYYNALNK